TKLFALLLSSTASLCLAQLDNAAILGTILDTSGAVIPGASVVIQNQGTSATVNLTTDANGNFVAPVLSVGVYRVTVSAKGFKTHVRENITLRVSDRTRLELTLDAGDISERVTVVAEAP